MDPGAANARCPPSDQQHSRLTHHRRPTRRPIMTNRSKTAGEARPCRGEDQTIDSAELSAVDRRAVLATVIRGRCAVETLHHLRDVAYAEDASQLRTGNASRAMATCRNLAIGVLDLAGLTARRRRPTPQRQRPERPPTLLGST